MNTFSKTCPACNEHFTSLTDYMEHVKNKHQDIPPHEILKMGKEHKWKLREQNFGV